VYHEVLPLRRARAILFFAKIVLTFAWHGDILLLRTVREKRADDMPA